LVNEIILYYDARSKKHQIIFMTLASFCHYMKEAEFVSWVSNNKPFWFETQPTHFFLFYIRNQRGGSMQL